MCTLLAKPKCFDQDRTAQAPLKHRQQSFLKSEQLQTNSNSTSKRPVVNTKSKPQTSQESSRAARVCQYTAQGYSGRLPGLCLPASGLLPGLHGRLHRRRRLERCGLRPPRAALPPVFPRAAGAVEVQQAFPHMYFNVYMSSLQECLSIHVHIHVLSPLCSRSREDTPYI